MKKRRLASVIILGLITFGIYDIYWLISTRKELTAKGHPVPSLWRVIVYPLLGIVAGIVFSIAASNQNTKIFNILAILLIMAGFVAAVVFGIRFLAAYCQAAEQVTNGDLAYHYGFWMGILMYLFRVGFIWEAIVQYHYNRIGLFPAGADSVLPNQAPTPATSHLQPQSPQPPPDPPLPQNPTG